MSLIESNKWKYIYTFFNLENCVDAKFSKNEKMGEGIWIKSYILT